MSYPGSAIRAMRTAQGLSLRQLAELSGTSFAYLSKVERDQRVPTSRWLIAVTDALAQHVTDNAA